jgi:hypothetical protein
LAALFLIGAPSISVGQVRRIMVAVAKPYSIPYPHLRMVSRIREESANDREYAAC